jgi:acyl carrier protein
MPINTIIKIIAETMRLDPDTVTPATRLETLGIDSLKAINILFELEEIYDVEVPNEVIAELQTVSDIEKTLQALLDKK